MGRERERERIGWWGPSRREGKVLNIVGKKDKISVCMMWQFLALYHFTLWMP